MVMVHPVKLGLPSQQVSQQAEQKILNSWLFCQVRSLTMTTTKYAFLVPRVAKIWEQKLPRVIRGRRAGRLGLAIALADSYFSNLNLY